MCRSKIKITNFLFQCQAKLVNRQKLMRENFKVNHGIADNCRDDIKKHHCLQDVSHTKHGRMSQILLCLEGANKETKGTL